MIKINFNPNRDWRRLVIVWLAGVVVILVLAILVYLFLFDGQLSREQQNQIANSQNDVLDKRAFENTVGMIKNRAAEFQSRQNFPANLVDPSL